MAADFPRRSCHAKAARRRLNLQFEAASRLDPEEERVILSVIESIIPRNTMKEAARRFATTDSGASR